MKVRFVVMVALVMGTSVTLAGCAEENGLSQADAARILELSPQRISQLTRLES